MRFFSTRSAKKPIQPGDLPTDSNAAIEIDLTYEGIATIKGFLNDLFLKGIEIDLTYEGIATYFERGRSLVAFQY